MTRSASAAALLLAALLAAGCERKPAAPTRMTPAVDSATPALPPVPVTQFGPSAPQTDAWIGRWTGPEGLFLDIARGGEPGHYAITIKGDLDSTGDRVIGVAEHRAIRFRRNGRTEVLRPSSGLGTGLKWLAGKKDCLTVAPGEGYCRD